MSASNDTQLQQMREVCANIGAALLACQTTEKLFNVSIMWLFPEQPHRTMEMIERMENELQRKTLGYFVRALRERVGLDPNFDQLLGDFLDHRNTLAHDLLRIPGHSFDTPQGFQQINSFALNLFHESMRVT